MSKHKDFSEREISTIMTDNFITLRDSITVREATEYIRTHTTDDQIVYYYVTDEDNVLVGVVSSRSLLTAPLDARLESILIKRIKYVPEKATVRDIWEEFIFHKYLALPVVNKDRQIVGVVDISVFTDNVIDIMEGEKKDQIFEIIGYKLSQIRDVSALKIFRFRFPWLIATIISGTICAILVSQFEMVLAQSIILAFFLTLVLGLGESVSMQTMTVTIQTLRNIRPPFVWYLTTFFQELRTALLLGIASALLVFFTIILWQGETTSALVIGGSIILSLTVASLTGLVIPSMLHLLKLDLKIASGPLTLALADIFTVAVYFSAAALLLN